MGAKHANWFVTSAKTTGWLRETELVPKTQGIVTSVKQMKFALGLARRGKVPPPFPPHVAGRSRRRAPSTISSRRRSRGSARHRAGRARARPHRARRGGAGRGMKRVAYYKGCLASLSAKELDSSTQALAPKVGLELVDLESVTCCGAGDIHEAEPDYYLHLNARILAYAEAEKCDTLLTVCNVCTLNLRQANWQLKKDEALRERVSTNLQRVGAPPYNGTVEVRHLLWEIAEGDGYELLKPPRTRG